MTNIQQAMIDLHEQIYNCFYYPDLYQECVLKCGMTEHCIVNAEHTDDQIINLCNSFWLALPDSPSIRRQPFFALCDIAEHCFDEEEYDNN